MSAANNLSVGEISPTDAWALMAKDESARLIDVRTQAEWAFVGVPNLSELGHDLICIEWAVFPGMSKNTRFAEAVKEVLGAETPGPLMFLCRSGVRSLYAAEAVTTLFAASGQVVECLNIVGGFEGDLNQNGHRGFHNGWKHHGLAWRQS